MQLDIGRTRRTTGRSSGASLVEVLVATGLLLLLSTVVVVGFVAASRLYTWVSTRCDVGTQALIGLVRLEGEVRNSSFESLTIVTTPSVVAMSFEVQDPALEASSLVLPSFQPAPYFVVYYDDVAHSILVRKTYAAGQSPLLGTSPAFGTLTRLQPSDLLTVVGGRTGTEHTMASSVAAMIVNPSSYPPVSATGLTSVVAGVNVQLTISRSASLLTGHADTLQEQVQTLMRPRN